MSTSQGGQSRAKQSERVSEKTTERAQPDTDSHKHTPTDTHTDTHTHTNRYTHTEQKCSHLNINLKRKSYTMKVPSTYLSYPIRGRTQLSFIPPVASLHRKHSKYHIPLAPDRCKHSHLLTHHFLFQRVGGGAGSGSGSGSYQTLKNFQNSFHFLFCLRLWCAAAMSYV